MRGGDLRDGLERGAGDLVPVVFVGFRNDEGGAHGDEIDCAVVVVVVMVGHLQRLGLVIFHDGKVEAD